jgi:hypothetical protein
VPPAGAPLSGNLVSNAIVLIVVVIMPVAKITPVQRLKILLWASDTRQPTNPLFLSNKNNGLQEAKSGSSIPLNLLGGYRWLASVAVDSETLRKIIRAEIGGTLL